MDMGGHGTGLDWGTMAMLNEIFFWTMIMFGIWHTAAFWVDFGLLLYAVSCSCHVISCHGMFFSLFLGFEIHVWMDSDGLGRQTPGLAWWWHWVFRGSMFMRVSLSEKKKRLAKSGREIGSTRHETAGDPRRRYGFLEFGESGTEQQSTAKHGIRERGYPGHQCFFCMLGRSY